jgi:hypothetical protein
MIDDFDVEAFAHMVEDAGAGYVIWSATWCSYHFPAPVKAIDRIAPGHTSQRDLMVYLPSGAPAADPVARKAFGWQWGSPGGWQLPGEPIGGRLAEFQRNWEAVIREWSRRWGYSVSGWWIDGCHFADQMYRFGDEPNFASFARVLRAGKPFLLGRGNADAVLCL